MNSNKNEQIPVSSTERSQINRNVLVWLNMFPDLPVGVITTEPLLPVDAVGMALSAITSAYINKSYILGGYQAEYSFKIIYRIKPLNSINARLDALELLNNMGDWCRANKPDLGDKIRVLKVSPTSQAELYAPYENGDEDYFITMKIIYEVNVNG